MKKLLVTLLAGVMVLGCVACGAPKGTEKSEVGASENVEVSTNEDTLANEDAAASTHIYVLTAPEDHGWTGSVATFAKEKISEVNGEGTYSTELITSSDAAEQIVNIEDIISKNEENIAVVIQPIDDTVQSAIQQLVDAEIPYVAFDRIIEGVSNAAVSNVKGDNEGIGAGAAAYFVSLGMKPGEKVYVYEGDTSSVTTLRNNGFTKYLTGDFEFDGQTIADDAKWSDEDLKVLHFLVL